MPVEGLHQKFTQCNAQAFLKKNLSPGHVSSMSFFSVGWRAGNAAPWRLENHWNLLIWLKADICPMRLQESATKNKAPHRARHKIKFYLKRKSMLSLIILLFLLLSLKAHFLHVPTSSFWTQLRLLKTCQLKKCAVVWVAKKMKWKYQYFSWN
jgi:hypothetical protein